MDEALIDKVKSFLKISVEDMVDYGKRYHSSDKFSLTMHVFYFPEGKEVRLIQRSDSKAIEMSDGIAVTPLECNEKSYGELMRTLRQKSSTLPSIGSRLLLGDTSAG